MPPALTGKAWAQIRYDYEHTERPIHEICAEHGISTGTLRDRMRRWHWARRRPPIPDDGPPPLPAPAPQIATTPFASVAPSVADVHVFDAAAAPSALRDDSQRDLPHPSASPSPGGDPLPPGEGESREVGAPAAADRAHTPAPGLAAVAPIAAGADVGAPGESDGTAIVPRLQSAVARVLPAIEATVAKLAAGATHPRELERAARALAALTRTLRELDSLLSQRQAAAASAADNDAGPEDIEEFRLELARRMDAIVEARQAAERSGET